MPSHRRSWQRATLAGAAAATLVALSARAEALDDGSGGLGTMGGMIDPRIVALNAEAGVSVDRELPTDVAGEDAEFSRTATRAQLRFQPYHDDHQEVVVTAADGRLDTQGGVVLPQTGPLPTHFYDLRVGATYRYVEHDGTIWGVSGTLDSDSERPFRDGNDQSAGGTVFTRQPYGKGEAWVFFVAYSDQRAEFSGIPVPGFVYMDTRNPAWTWMPGFPFTALAWHPRPTLHAEALVSGFGAAHLGISWAPDAHFRPFHLHAAGDYGGDTWRPDNDPVATDNVQFRELRWTAGTALELGPGRRVDVYGGWSMLRWIYEGRDVLHNDNGVHLRPGLIAGGTAIWRF